MSRYADCSQEVLYRDGKLIGFNAGYGYHTEHEYGYKGDFDRTEMKSYLDKHMSRDLFQSAKLVNIQN